MTDVDSELELVLSRARRSWSATPADAERVLRATSLAIEAAPALAATSGKLAIAASSKWIAALVATALGVGAGGYALGYRAGQLERDVRDTPEAAPERAEPPSPITAAEPQPQPQPQPQPAPELAVPRPLAPAGPARSDRLDPDFDPAPSLAAETRAMRRIERALRDEKPALALRLLAQLERAPVPGQLLEERAAANALAHCAQAPELERARMFDQHYPHSVYRARVERACAADSGSEEKSP